MKWFWRMFGVLLVVGVASAQSEPNDLDTLEQRLRGLESRVTVLETLTQRKTRTRQEIIDDWRNGLSHDNKATFQRFGMDIYHKEAEKSLKLIGVDDPTKKELLYEMKRLADDGWVPSFWKRYGGWIILICIVGGIIIIWTIGYCRQEQTRK